MLPKLSTAKKLVKQGKFGMQKGKYSKAKGVTDLNTHGGLHPLFASEIETNAVADHSKQDEYSYCSSASSRKQRELDACEEDSKGLTSSGTEMRGASIHI